MATIASTALTVFKKTRIYTWAGLGTQSASDAGDWLDLSSHSDKCLEITGTWNGATLVFQGANSAAGQAAAQTLNDPLGNPLSFTSGAPIKQILENTRYVRPLISSGGASTNLQVDLCAKKEY